jgi:hypothetical protein
MKKIPIGIDNFYKLVDENYYFADKSLFIKEIVEEDSQVLLIPRPRRFGKSLNMSMLKYFFTNKNAEKNRRLFNGLKIENESEIMKLQGKYPIIYINFKDVKELSWENCYNKTKELIQNIFDEFNYLAESPKLSKLDKINFDKILLGEGTQSNYESSLKFLSKLLYNYHGEKPIVLIDEYDQPIISSYMNNFYKEGISFYRNILSAVLKDNEYLEKAVLTGILRVAKESIFSGLNNLKVDSILKNQFNYFGLLEEEVKEILEYYKMSYELEEVKKWYNGYIFGEKTVYNPWSIINFIDYNELKSFWVNTSSNDLIRDGLSNLSSINYKQFVELINLKPIKIEIEENISFEMLDNPDVIWNLMLFSGYLTLDKNKLVMFPNKEVKDFYISEFKRLAGYSINNFNSLLNYLMNKDIKNFKGLLQEIFYTAVSYYDTDKEEKYYHNLILGFVFGLSDNYEIRSNREYGTGRVDLLLKSKNDIFPNYIFEFKVSKKREDLENDCKKALEQIEEKKYGLEIKNPVKIGMSFYKKEIEVLIKE